MTTPTKEGLMIFNGASSSRNITVEHVIANSNSLELPLLTKANYHKWALVMQVPLEALELWDAVEKECKERARDRRALAAILCAVPSEMKAGLTMKKSEYEDVGFHDSKSVDDFALWINGLVVSIWEMGEKLEDHRVMKKIIRIIPKHLKQVAVAIEMLTDLNTATIKELVGRLHVAEDVDNEDVKEVTAEAERLYLTEEQWEARRQQRNKERRRSGNGGNARRSGNDGDWQRSGGNRGRGDGDDRSDIDDDACSTASSCSRRGWSRNWGHCFECGEPEHIARFCREKKKTKETAMLANAGDAYRRRQNSSTAMKS
ncbi:hypothetical protein BS78_05G080800 [Paspalum vaginatum]|nr:hypothetical protein BS78_05G080800 [Paspalum vaginatum]